MIVNCAGLILFFCVEDYAKFDIVRWFDFALEKNIPTLYSSLSLLFCSILLFITGTSNLSDKVDLKPYWTILALVFSFLALDEWFMIHEKIGIFLDRRISATGFFYFPWVIPYGIGLGIFSLIYLQFLRALPERTRYLFILSGLLYIFGVLGVEMISAKEAELHGLDTVRYAIFYTIEEFLEMTGIVVFIYALLDHLPHKDDDDGIL